MKKILPLFYNLTGIKGIKSKKIKDGITNINYKVSTLTQDYVIRIPRENLIGINRINEKKVIELVKPLNINVDIVYYDENTGILISKFIKSSKRNKISFEKISSCIKKLHSIECNDIEKFDPFELISKYKTIVKDINFDNENKLILKVKEIYQNYPLVLCHNDLLYANFINCKKTNYLIDYEYAGKNIAIFDIVSFLNENDIEDIDKQLEFIKSYYEKVDNKLLNDINTMFVFLDLLWAYWAYMMYKLYNDNVFLTIALNKHKRYNLKSHIY